VNYKKCGPKDIQSLGPGCLGQGRVATFVAAHKEHPILTI